MCLMCFSDFTIFTLEEYDNTQNKSAARVTHLAASSLLWSPERTPSLGILQIILLVLPVILRIDLSYIYLYVESRVRYRKNGSNICGSFDDVNVLAVSHLVTVPVVS